MPMKKRLQKRPLDTYEKFRATQWEYQGRDEHIDFRASKLKDGGELTANYLQPKKVLFFKDVYHCPDLAAAKKLACEILQYEQVHYLELKGYRWLYVDFHGTGPHELPGQEVDDRKRLRG